MSADLLAEFGGGSTSRSFAKPLRASQTHQHKSLLLDEELFEGLVEARSSINTNDNQASLNRPLSDPTRAHSEDSRPVPPIHTASSDHAGTLWRQDDHGTDILFDAATEDITVDVEDDWGEFESAEIPTAGMEPTDLRSWNACGTIKGDPKQSITPSEKRTAKSDRSSPADLLSSPNDVPGDQLKDSETYGEIPLTTARVKFEEQISQYPASRSLSQVVGDEDWCD